MGKSVNKEFEEGRPMPYPNPAREMITVNSDLAGGYTNMSLFDVSGNYFLRLTSATEKATRQVVFID